MTTLPGGPDDERRCTVRAGSDSWFTEWQILTSGPGRGGRFVPEAVACSAGGVRSGGHQKLLTCGRQALLPDPTVCGQRDDVKFPVRQEA